jgi:hypothetical protein
MERTSLFCKNVCEIVGPLQEALCQDKNNTQYLSQYKYKDCLLELAAKYQDNEYCKELCAGILHECFGIENEKKLDQHIKDVKILKDSQIAEIAKREDVLESEARQKGNNYDKNSIVDPSSGESQKKQQEKLGSEEVSTSLSYDALELTELKEAPLGGKQSLIMFIFKAIFSIIILPIALLCLAVSGLAHYLGGPCCSHGGEVLSCEDQSKTSTKSCELEERLQTTECTNAESKVSIPENEDRMNKRGA